tara:strand:+ start:118 stop:363 length:246 start_codon:yes stop_codon:yes gene_type:complete
MSKIISVKRKEPDYIEEQTFFNNGQFTEAEMDLMNEALNDLLQKTNRASYKALDTDDVPVAGLLDQMDDIEELIEKLQEGS